MCSNVGSTSDSEHAAGAEQLAADHPGGRLERLVEAHDGSSPSASCSSRSMSATADWASHRCGRRRGTPLITLVELGPLLLAVLVARARREGRRPTPRVAVDQTSASISATSTVAGTLLAQAADDVVHAGEHATPRAGASSRRGTAEASTRSSPMRSRFSVLKRSRGMQTRHETKRSSGSRRTNSRTPLALAEAAASPWPRRTARRRRSGTASHAGMTRGSRAGPWRRGCPAESRPGPAPLDLAGHDRDLPGGSRCTRPGVEAEEATLAGHLPVGAEPLDPDVVEVGGAVDGGAGVGLGQHQQVPARAPARRACGGSFVDGRARSAAQDPEPRVRRPLADPPRRPR